MNLLETLFGISTRPRHRAVVIDAPPSDVEWHEVRPKGDQSAVRARLADSDRNVRTEHGVLRARGGMDWIVVHGPDEESVVNGEIFQRTYEALGGGLYRKRTDLVLRYFTLDRPAIVGTLEGDQEAAPGDWIMQGVTGELWPVKPDKAREKYEPV
jgi:hypothetical protein